MLGTFFTKVADSATSFAASTSLGKSYGVKPAIRAEIEESYGERRAEHNQIAALACIKAMPQLNKAVRDLGNAGEAVFADLTSDQSLDILADIVGNHLGDFDSIEDFKKKLPKMASIKAMKTFANTLINTKNYTILKKMLIDLDAFSTQEKARQLEILTMLDNKTLPQTIAAENNQLNIEKIHADVKKMSKAVCAELNLTKAESNSLISLFDGLVNKHLKTLNPLRQQLVQQLPAFFDVQNARLREAYPALVALEKKKPATITPKFQSTTTTTKAASKKATAPKAAIHKEKETAEKPHNKRKQPETPPEEQEGRKFGAKKTQKNNIA